MRRDHDNENGDDLYEDSHDHSDHSTDHDLESDDDEGADGDVTEFATLISSEEFEDLQVASSTRTVQRRQTRSRTGPAWEPGDCDACQYASEHGWWGHGRPGRSHCRSCHRYWNSLQEGHCASCCRHFATSAAFDAHLAKVGCVDPVGVTRRDGSPRFRVREGRYGETWTLVNYRALPDFSSMSRHTH